jgi:hypothetical protein
MEFSMASGVTLSLTIFTSFIMANCGSFRSFWKDRSTGRPTPTTAVVFFTIPAGPIIIMYWFVNSFFGLHCSHASLFIAELMTNSAVQMTDSVGVSYPLV